MRKPWMNADKLRWTRKPQIIYAFITADYLLSHSIDFRFVSICVHSRFQFEVVSRESELYCASRYPRKIKNPTAAAIVAAIASYRVLFISSHAARTNEATAMICPPGSLKNAFGASLRF